MSDSRLIKIAKGMVVVGLLGSLLPSPLLPLILFVAGVIILQMKGIV